MTLQSNSASSLPHALRPMDIKKVNSIVQRAGYEPFTAEASYFVNALCLKKCFLLSEKLDALSAKKMSQHDVVRKNETELPNPVCSSLSDIEAVDEWDQKKKDDVVAVLECEGGNDSREIVRRMMRRMMTQELLALFNRNGTDGKRKFRGVFENLVKSAVKNVCAKNGTEFDVKAVEQRVAVVLKGASDKCGRESCRGNRRVLSDSNHSEDM